MNCQLSKFVVRVDYWLELEHPVLRKVPGSLYHRSSYPEDCKRIVYIVMVTGIISTGSVSCKCVLNQYAEHRYSNEQSKTRQAATKNPDWKIPAGALVFQGKT